MITDEQVRRIALFFLYSLMDEKIALHAAGRVVAHIKTAHPSYSAKSEPISDKELILMCWSQWPQHRAQSRNSSRPTPRGRSSGPAAETIPSASWSLPDRTDLGPWMKFHRSASDEEIVAATLAKLLGFSEQDIADGLNVSLGTVRYRIGKAVRQIGAAV